jgi:D-alanine-D-alanine ligase
VAEKIQHLSKRVYKVLHLSGYGRIDIRMDEEGRMFVLEANPNPQLAYGEDFAESAERMGIKYPQLIQKLLTTGLRWKADRLG